MTSTFGSLPFMKLLDACINYRVATDQRKKLDFENLSKKKNLGKLRILNKKPEILNKFSMLSSKIWI